MRGLWRNEGACSDWSEGLQASLTHIHQTPCPRIKDTINHDTSCIAIAMKTIQNSTFSHPVFAPLATAMYCSVAVTTQHLKFFGSLPAEVPIPVGMVHVEPTTAAARLAPV